MKKEKKGSPADQVLHKVIREVDDLVKEIQNKLVDVPVSEIKNYVIINKLDLRALLYSHRTIVRMAGLLNQNARRLIAMADTAARRIDLQLNNEQKFLR
jgi:hypothetical protein